MRKLLTAKVKGDSTYIASLITIFFIIVIWVAAFMSYVQLGKMSEVERMHRKYLLVMERDGYLTAANKVSLEAELAAAGVVNINLAGTSMAPVGYGNTIHLVIDGDLKIEELVVSGGSFVKKEGLMHVNIDKTGTALY